MAMLPLTKVSHEHHDLIWRSVRELHDLADCLDCDCLDSAGLATRLPELAELHAELERHLVPHMDAVEAVVYPTLARLMADRAVTVPMADEHREIRRLVAAIGSFATDHADGHADRTAVLALRRMLLRLHALLSAHLCEEELYIPILEDRSTPAQEAALARALDHLLSERL
jgi:iron-sulfur cluster repair protein YtfE (RIC family)